MEQWNDSPNGRYSAGKEILLPPVLLSHAYPFVWANTSICTTSTTRKKTKALRIKNIPYFSSFLAWFRSNFLLDRHPKAVVKLSLMLQENHFHCGVFTLNGKCIRLFGRRGRCGARGA